MKFLKLKFCHEYNCNCTPFPRMALILKNDLISYLSAVLIINSSKKVLQFKFDLLYITLFSVFSSKIGIIRKLV